VYPSKESIGKFNKEIKGGKMLQKISRILIIMVILFGLAFTVVNFTPPLHALASYGTTTLNTTMSHEAWTHLYDDYFCYGHASDCCIAFEN